MVQYNPETCFVSHIKITFITRKKILAVFDVYSSIDTPFRNVSKNICMKITTESCIYVIIEN